MRILYRMRQFWQRATAGPMPAGVEDEIDAILNLRERALFARFANSDRWHSYRVYQTLQAAGLTQPALLKAALLHDIGKTRVRLTIWERTLIVVAGMLWPQRSFLWGQGEPVGWRRPFVVKVQHPEWGAGMALAAGCEPGVVALIRRHQEIPARTDRSEETCLLRLLQWADEQH